MLSNQLLVCVYMSNKSIYSIKEIEFSVSDTPDVKLIHNGTQVNH
jgi:hypothetical protein